MKLESVKMNTEDKFLTKNFKNLRIDVQQPPVSDDMVCQCPTYFNIENKVEVNSSQENSPTTVRSISSDSSSCTYGTHYPNRVFVGHLPGKANATDLADFFSQYGTVLEGKVVLDSYGRSRRFGFVTFTSYEDVQNVLSQGSIFFRGKKINVGPAVKKMFGADHSPPATPNTVCSDTSSTSTASDVENPDDTIITVPPVNEVKDDTSSGGKTGNVWLKVSSKPKSPMKKSAEEINSPTSPQVFYTQQQSYPYQQYYTPTYYTVPYNQMFNYQPYYMTYSPDMYSPTYVQSPYFAAQQYVRGPVSVS